MTIMTVGEKSRGKQEILCASTLVKWARESAVGTIPEDIFRRREVCKKRGKWVKMTKRETTPNPNRAEQRCHERKRDTRKRKRQTTPKPAHDQISVLKENKHLHIRNTPPTQLFPWCRIRYLDISYLLSVLSNKSFPCVYSPPFAHTKNVRTEGGHTPKLDPCAHKNEEQPMLFYSFFWRFVLRPTCVEQCPAF